MKNLTQHPCKFPCLDVQRHEAGLNNLAKPLEKTACLRPNLKANVVGQIIEDSTPSFPNAINPGDGSKSRRGYHYVTRGFVLNEIMRRVDPKGRTIGQFIREELKGCEGKIYSDEIIAHHYLPYVLAVLK